MNPVILLYLFLFSMITLPLIVPRKRTGKSLISGLSVLFERPWSIILYALPVAAVMSGEMSSLPHTSVPYQL
jgi:hypothetical protein